MGPTKLPRTEGAAGSCAGSQYAARRANLRCYNLFGAVALTACGLEIAVTRDSGNGESPVWAKVQSGSQDKLRLLGTIGLCQVAEGFGAPARGPNQAAGRRPGVSDLWHSPLFYCWS